MLKKVFVNNSDYVKVEDKNRFYYMLQQMQSNRWKITVIVLFLFFFIIFGINVATLFGIGIQESWNEMLLILLGAFVGNLNKVVDYWFNSEDRDKMLIQKVDEEDGTSLSSAVEYPTTPRPPQGPVVVYTQVKEEAPVVTEEPVTYTEPEVYEEPIVEEYPAEEPTQEGEENI